MPSLVRLTVVLAAASCLNAETYKDPVTGVEVKEIAPEAMKASNLYFHLSNFTADNRYVVLTGVKDATGQIFLYEVATGKMEAVVAGGGAASPHPVRAEIVYFLRDAKVFEYNIATRKERLIGEIPEPRAGGYQQPTLTADHKGLTISKQRDAANWEIGIMDLATGQWRTVVTTGFRIGHTQHHPSKPVIFYVWETGGYAPQRTWLVNDDGTANRPFYYVTDPKQWYTTLKEWVTHEAWIAGTGDMTMIVDKVGVVVVGLDGKSRLLPGDYWHAAARPDGRFLVTDDNKGNLWLIETATDSRRLLATGLRNTVRAVHAHASFDRTGRYILLNSGRTVQTVALIDLGPGAAMSSAR